MNDSNTDPRNSIHRLPLRDTYLLIAGLLGGFGLFIILALGVFSGAQATYAEPPPDPKPLIKESPKRVRISDNPLVNPASFKPLPSLPRAAYSAPRTEKEIEDSGWQKARWSHYTLRVSGAANKSLFIATPSVVMLKASWHNKTEITFSLIKNGTTIASAKSGTRFDKSRLATIHAKVPSAGNLVIRAANNTSTPAAVDLYIGILTVSEK